ncbi:uroporphyrinogen decarboxylase family protein [Bacteroidota bacterium]
MTERERFHATMSYGPRDRSPICDFSFWDETLPEWHKQGLPASVNLENSDDFFGMDTFSHLTGVHPGLSPEFEVKVIEDRGDNEVIQQEDGVWVIKRKTMSSIPQHLRHLLVDRTSWEKHYKPRLDPDNPARYPADWDARVAEWTNPDRDYVIQLPGGSLFGWIRNWMGIENLALLLYDDPVLFEEMVETIADCQIGLMTRILETGGHFDGCSLWEDMAYRSGPLISPAHFERFLVPHYRRITDLMHHYDVNVTWVDCDGDIGLLAPLWLEAGVNCMFPIEVGTWGADPVEYRKEYGKDMLLVGGFSKRILAGSKKNIDAEIRRLTPLVEEGGYIGFCDHRVPPDVPLDNYWHYLEQVRDIWGYNTNLKPMGKLDPTSS